MSNFFEEVLDDVNAVEEKLLGPDYAYWKQIKSPSEMGMSTKGSISTIAKDVGGLINYVELLVAGGGGASRTSGAMGNKFFLKTAATCKDKASGEIVIPNNIPEDKEWDWYRMNNSPQVALIKKHGLDKKYKVKYVSAKEFDRIKKHNFSRRYPD